MKGHLSSLHVSHGFVSSQVAGLILPKDDAHVQAEPTFIRPAREKSVRNPARQRGKEEDDVPSAAPYLLPLHPPCDGHSPVLLSPRVTAAFILCHFVGGSVTTSAAHIHSGCHSELFVFPQPLSLESTFSAAQIAQMTFLNLREFALSGPKLCGDVSGC